MRVILGIALMSATALAQDKTCTRQSASGHASVVIMGRLDTVDPTTELPTHYLTSALASLRDAFRASGALPLVSFTTITKDTVTYAMTSAVEFQVTRDGHIQDSRVIATSLSGALDSIVLRAIARVDSARSLLTLPREVQEPAHLLFTTSVASSDTGTKHSGKNDSDDGVTGPLIRTTVPVWTSFKLPSMKPYTRAPEYPLSAVALAREDSVMAVFVIDESGVVIPSTVYLSTVTYEDFGMSVVKWLTGSQTRYRPGIVGGCPSRILVTQAFSYKLPRTPH